jgi:transposase
MDGTGPRFDPVAAKTMKAKEMLEGSPKRHRDKMPTYLRHHIINAATEGLNSMIQSLKAAARGCRKLRNYWIRTLCFCEKRIPTMILEESP